MTTHQGLEALELRAPDGASTTLLLQGAHLLSWRPAGAGEQLYVSPKSSFVPGEPVRGGVPVAFPQFAALGPGLFHGFARVKPWQLVSAEGGSTSATAFLRLVDDESTLQIWPHRFALELWVRVAGRGLTIDLSCENRDDAPFEFTAALHTYLGLSSLADTRVGGLSNLRYWDKLTSKGGRQGSDDLVPDLPLDRVYYQVMQNLSMHERQANQANRCITIRQQGFADAVIWNPGAERCTQLPDMPADGWRDMLCIEAAAVGRPIRLAPGERWAGMQSLRLA